MEREKEERGRTKFVRGRRKRTWRFQREVEGATERYRKKYREKEGQNLKGEDEMETIGRMSKISRDISYIARKMVIDLHVSLCSACRWISGVARHSSGILRLELFR